MSRLWLTDVVPRICNYYSHISSIRQQTIMTIMPTAISCWCYVFLGLFLRLVSFPVVFLTAIVDYFANPGFFLRSGTIHYAGKAEKSFPFWGTSGPNRKESLHTVAAGVRPNPSGQFKDPDRQQLFNAEAKLFLLWCTAVLLHRGATQLPVQSTSTATLFIGVSIHGAGIAHTYRLGTGKVDQGNPITPHRGRRGKLRGG